MEKTNHLQLIFGNQTLGITGNNYSYIFNYAKGGLESLNISGKEWLYRIPRPTFWRATTDNDRGNDFSRKSSVWLGADLFSHCVKCHLQINGESIPVPVIPLNKYPQYQQASEVILKYTFATATDPVTYVDVKYTVSNLGVIIINFYYHGCENLPELPALGLRLIMPTVASKYIYKGLAGETYPDRMNFASAGTFEMQGLPVTPYLVPQDCQMHMQSQYLKIYRNATLNNADNKQDEFTLSLQQINAPFNFSCLPYTAEELENAFHIEDLPLPRRTVLCIYGPVRGVGGIDSWGSDVGKQYQIYSQKDYKFSFEIVPY